MHYHDKNGIFPGDLISLSSKQLMCLRKIQKREFNAPKQIYWILSIEQELEETVSIVARSGPSSW